MAIESRESITESIRCLKAAIETETIKINSLNRYTNYLQVRAWREYRKKLRKNLTYYEGRLKLYQ